VSALVVGGALLIVTQSSGWYHTFGILMLIVAFCGIVFISVGEWLRARSQR
jgi:hypothetical protein